MILVFNCVVLFIYFFFGSKIDIHFFRSYYSKKKKVLIKTIKIITSELYKTRMPTDSETQVHH